MESDISS